MKIFLVKNSKSKNVSIHLIGSKYNNNLFDDGRE